MLDETGVSPSGIPRAVDARTGSSPACKRILLVDDNELVRATLVPLLSFIGFEPIAVDCGEAALAALERGLDPRIVLLDMDMPGLSGAETLVQIRALRPDLPVLICTGRFDPTDQLLVQHYPNVELLHKPIKLADLQARLA